MRLLLLLSLVACSRDPGPSSAAKCSCTPANVSLTRALDEARPMDGIDLLARLRKHQALVRAGTNPRGVKVYDDELKLAVINFCQPCGDWISDRVTIDEMFPLAKLDAAARAVCMGLVLRDGTTVHGDAHPRCP